jgi:YVTN family beta-propeller protein
VVVANSGDDTAMTFDQAARTPAAPVPVGRTPRAVTIAGLNGRVLALIANEGDGSLSILDTATRQVVATVAVGGRPSAVAAAVDGSRAYVLDGQGGNVVTVDLRENRTAGTLRVGDRLTGLDTTADGQFLLVTADDATNNLYRVDLSTDQVAGTFSVGAGALAVVSSPRAARAYVTTSDNRLVLWDTAAERVAGMVPVGRRPEGVAVRVTVAPGPVPSPSPSPGVVAPVPSPGLGATPVVGASPSPVPTP